MPSVTEVYLRYFKVHTAYVLLCYGDSKFKSISPQVGRSTSRVLERIVARCRANSPEVTSKISDIFAAELHNLARRSQTPKGHDNAIDDFSTRIVRDIVVQKDRWESLQADFQFFMENVGQAIGEEEVAPLLIFDGLDNINWTKSNKFYSDSCAELGRVCNMCVDLLTVNARILFFTRPETFSEFHLQNDRLEGYNHGLHQTFRLLRIEPPDLKGVLEQKFSAAKRCHHMNALVRGVWRINAHGQDTIDDKCGASIDRMEALVHQYTNVIEEELRELNLTEEIGRLCRERQMDENLLGYLFDNDVRALLECFLKVAALDKFYKDTKGPTAFNKWRVLQYLMLNGEPFCITSEFSQRRKDRGNVFPNIFWFDVDKLDAGSRAWHGLIAVSLIEMTGQLQLRMRDMMYFLQGAFGYSDQVIVEIFEALVAFSILDVVPSQNGSDNLATTAERPSALFNKYGNKYFVTTKGQVFLKLLCARADSVYFFALDTPLMQGAIFNTTRLVRQCRSYEDIDTIENFYIAAVITTATLVNHMFAERKRMTNFWTKLSKKTKVQLAHTIFPLHKSPLRVLEGYLQSPETLLSGLETLAARANHVKSLRVVADFRNEVIGVLNFSAEEK